MKKKVFSKYIIDLFDLRLKAKSEKRKDLDSFYKLLMNGLYGKFG